MILRTRVLTNENGRVELSQRDLDPMFSLIDFQDLSGVRAFLSGVVCSTHTQTHGSTYGHAYSVHVFLCTLHGTYLERQGHTTQRVNMLFLQPGVCLRKRLMDGRLGKISSFNVPGIGLWNISPFRPRGTRSNHIGSGRRHF